MRRCFPGIIPATLFGIGSMQGTREVSLEGLSGSPLAKRFRTWRGQSGRRYIFSVFPMVPDPACDTVPELADAVVIAAARQPDGTNRVVWVDRTDSYPELLYRSRKMVEARARGALLYRAARSIR